MTTPEDFLARVMDALPAHWSDQQKIDTIDAWHLYRAEPEICEAISQRIEENPEISAVYLEVEEGTQRVLTALKQTLED